MAGLAFFGFSLGLVVRADLGLAPWDVFHQGVSQQLGWSLGTVIVATSFVVVVLWIQKTYAMRVQFGVHACDLAACVLFLTHLVFESLRHGFSPGYAFNWEVLLDAATVPPLLLETREAPWLGGSWLSFAFLRVIRFRAAFVRLQQLGVFEARARARPSLPLLPPSENVPSLARALPDAEG